MFIKNHRLQGEEVTQYKCSKNKTKLRNHIALVLHYTANNDVHAAARYLTMPGVFASAHVLIGRDGEVIQMVPMDTEAWHAGKSTLDQLDGLNHFSIGVEFVNHGKLLLMNHRFYSWNNKVVDPSEVYILEDPHTGHRSYWHRYTQAQLQIGKQVVRQIVRHYKIRKIVQHSDVSPGRKIDPGEAFPFSEFKALEYRK
ncbi:N-acetylmuramoyl-L-alanine amidase [Puteibacter caeruleilacunae]|nr:N-acetylmuramoyl-L-alanine amidase [Puteibacter caeruleilacunae]